MTREEQVLAVLQRLSWHPHTTSEVVRRLHLAAENPSDHNWRVAIPLTVADLNWCPVLPPHPKEQCATVPRNSRDRCRRVLETLARKGKIKKIRMFRRQVSFQALS